MKRLILSLVLSCCALTAPIMVSGCAGWQPGAAPSTVLNKTLTDEKALYVVLSAVKGANVLAEAAVDTNLLKAGSPNAIKVADLLLKATQARQVAEQAYKAGNATDFNSAIADALDLVAQIQAIIAGK